MICIFIFMASIFINPALLVADDLYDVNGLLNVDKHIDDIERQIHDDKLEAYRQFDNEAYIVTVDGLAFRNLFLSVENDNNYLWLALSANPLNLSNDPKLTLLPYQWSRVPQQTPEIVSDLRTVLRANYNRAKNEGKKFIVISHSWGTVLTYLALALESKGSNPITPDLYVTLSSPLGTGNVKIDSPVINISATTIYDAIVAYTLEFHKEVLDKNKCKGCKPKVKRAVNYWALGDFISGPLGSYLKAENIQVDTEYRNGRSKRIGITLFDGDITTTDYWHKYTSLFYNTTDTYDTELKYDVLHLIDQTLTKDKLNIGGFWKTYNSIKGEYGELGPNYMYMIHEGSKVSGMILDGIGKNFGWQTMLKGTVSKSGTIQKINLSWSPESGTTVNAKATIASNTINGSWSDNKGNSGTWRAERADETPPISDNIPPSKPGSLIAKVLSTSQIDLSWKASTDFFGIKDYKVYKNGSFLKSANGTAVSDTGLNANTRYCYQVTARDNSDNESEKSNEICPVTKKDTIPPAIPQNLVATAISSNQINLSWDNSTEADFAGHNIFRNKKFIDKTTASAYSDKTLSPATRYCYRLTAFDKSGNVSRESNESCADTFATADTTPPTVTNFNIPETSSSLTVPITSFEATDNPGGSGVTAYMVTETSTRPSKSDSNWSTSKPTSHTFATTGPNTLYAWVKDVADNVSTGTVSDSVNINITTPPTVSSVTINDFSQSSVCKDGTISNNGTITGSGSGTITYVWITRYPDTSYHPSSEMQTTMTNGSASIPSYNGFPTSTTGDYTRNFVRVTSPAIVESNYKSYTVQDCGVANVSGYWKAYHTVPSDYGTYELGPELDNLSQSGTSLNGTVLNTNTPMSGSLSGNNITLSFTLQGKPTTTSIGTVNGNTMSGTWSDTNNNTGVWRAEKINFNTSAKASDFAGIWTGNATFSAASGEGGTCSTVLTLSLNGNQLTGILSGSNCTSGHMDTSNFPGTVTNGIFTFYLPNSEPSNPDCANWNMPFFVTLSSDLTTLNLYSSGKVCSHAGGQPGSLIGTLTKQQCNQTSINGNWTCSTMQSDVCDGGTSTMNLNLNGNQIAVNTQDFNMVTTYANNTFTLDVSHVDPFADPSYSATATFNVDNNCFIRVYSLTQNIYNPADHVNCFSICTR
jgi:chitodextrinase